MRNYLIDGNNYLGDLGKDRSKEHIEWLIRTLQNTPIKARFIIFFDGRTPFGSERIDQSRVKVVWQDLDLDKDADDTIVRYVNSLKSSGDYILVTRDNELRLRCGGAVSKIIKPKDFAEILARKIKQPLTSDDDDKSLTQGEVDEINSELLEYFSSK